MEKFKEIAVEARDNPQPMYGDDVISRVRFAQKDPEGKQKLQNEVIATLNKMITSFAKKAGINCKKVYFAVLVGNTCVHHFLWSLLTENLAFSPYVPVITGSMMNESRDLPRLSFIPHASVYTAPNVSAYVGGDIVADMIDIFLWQKKCAALMVDLGTNGEIILTSGGKVWACSVAAGPAFEGGRISSGMRDVRGAIDRVKITGQNLNYHVIDHAKASGICGTGIVDLVGELIELQIIQFNGRLLS